MSWLSIALAIGAFPVAWLLVLWYERLEGSLGVGHATTVVAAVAVAYGLLLGLVA